MKLLTLIIFCAFVSASANSYSQATKFNLDMKDVSIEEIFQKIEEQSDFVILYNEKTLDVNRKVDVNVKDKTVENILDQIFKGDKDAYRIFDKQIAIYPNEIRGLPTGNKTEIKADQKKELSGTVKDSKGLPLPGVTVIVKGTSQGTITDKNGEFKLSAPADAKTLVFSFVGMKTKELGIPSDAMNLKITMEETQLGLDEVVVVGYGSLSKKDITGSVGQVNISEMVKAPVATFDQALSGRVAGVQVQSSDGQPGSGTNIIIRGGNSITQSNEALYVIDGFPLENSERMPISPEDIASISVLKDASATAVYGSRGANGVIVIETKKGVSGKTVVNYNASYGFQTVTNKPKMMDPYDFVKYQFEIYPDRAAVYTDTLGLTLEDYRNRPAYDWQGMAFRTAPIQKHNFSLRGGNESTKYSVSGSLFNQDGVIINSDYDRYTGRMSLDHTISPKLKAGFNIAIAQTNSSGTPINAGSASLSSVMYNLWGFRPVIPDPNKDLTDELIDNDPYYGVNLRLNPISNLKEDVYTNEYSDISSNAYITYEIFKNLTLKVSGGINSRKSENDYFYSSKTTRGLSIASGVYGGINNAKASSWLNENTLTYDKVFNKNNRLNFVGGFTMQRNDNRSSGLQSILIPNEELGIMSLSSGTPKPPTSAGGYSTLCSFLGRVNYNFTTRYLVTFTMRADGSSKFAKGNKWGYFPSGALGWRIKEENFLKNVNAISNAKLRMSYGVTGNNRVGNFDYLPSLSLTNANGYSFGNATPLNGLVYKSMENSSLKWETTAQTDLGIDLGFLDERISLTVDLYKKNTTDLLQNADMPATTGFANVVKNIGKISNSGLEISVNTVNVKTKKFSWESNFNISFNRNKLLGLAENQNILLSSVTWDNFYANPLYVARIGEPVALFYGLIWDGNYQYSDFDQPVPGTYVLKANIPSNGSPKVQPGDIKYRDINGDGLVNSSDRTIIGNPQPIHIGGLSNNFRYQNLSLNVFLQWSYGNDLYNANRLLLEGNALARSNLNQFVSYNNRWTPENQNNEMFRAGGQGLNGIYSSMQIEDGSYLKLKTVSLEYALPKQFAKKVLLSGLSFNLTAQNLYTWTKYKGMDPEVSVRNSTLTPGFDFSAYPRARTIVFGVNASF